MIRELDHGEIRDAVAATRGDVLLHVGASLMLLAGLRASEVAGLLVQDWQSGDDPKLTVDRTRQGRTIRVAPSADALIGAYLAGEDAELDEPLLLGLKVQGVKHMLPNLFQEVMKRGGWHVDVHDLRHAAVAAVLETGAPMRHVEAYFGISKTDLGRKDLVPIREGYDREIAAVLEEAFGGLQP
jgi:integrase